MPSYSDVNRVYDLEPMIGSISDLTSAQLVSAFINPAEADMNARLSRRYTVPITGTIPLLQAIADDLSVYRALSRRVFTQDQLKDSSWPDRFKESMDTLMEIANGKVLLVDSAGAAVATKTNVANAQSNNMHNLPTFHEGGGWVDQVKDPDKTDDLLSDRDL